MPGRWQCNTHRLFAPPKPKARFRLPRLPPLVGRGTLCSSGQQRQRVGLAHGRRAPRSGRPRAAMTEPSSRVAARRIHTAERKGEAHQGPNMRSPCAGWHAATLANRFALMNPHG
jgi:hypothetical protein